MLRVRAAIGMVCMVGFCSMLFWFGSPSALPLSALLVVPFGIDAARFATGRRLIDELPLLARRLRGWKLGLFFALVWLLFVYGILCLWWLFSTARPFAHVNERAPVQEAASS